MMQRVAVSQDPPDPAEGDGDAGGVLAVCVLLFLAHGDYDHDQLTDLVAAFGLTHRRNGLPATLRTLQQQTLIAVDRRPTEHGEPPPAYRLTPGGRRWLDEYAYTLAEPSRLVTRFLQRHPARAATPCQADEPHRAGRPNQLGEDAGG